MCGAISVSGVLPYQAGRYDAGPAGHRQQPEVWWESGWLDNSSGGSQVGKACPEF